MNKKQCPKCGEENPAEAVMCWACYTPLSGNAPASGGAAPSSNKTLTHADSSEEKQKIPPWQLAVIGIGLLFALFTGFRTLMPATSGEDTDAPFSELPVEGGGAAPSPAAPTAPSAPAPQMPSGSGSVPVVEAPFKIVVPPNPRLAVATMAIIPTSGTTDGATAASYAAYVRRQFAGQSKRWNTLYIYVFSDAQSAQTFAKMMRQRRGAPLGEGDYSSLSSLWGSALARYEYSTAGGGRERVLYPSKNPSGWWYGR